jgi:HEAT repeat protein
MRQILHIAQRGFAVGIVTYVLLPAAASAQCIELRNPADLFAHAAVVFQGRVIKKEPTGITGDHVIVEFATLRVDRMWKGEAADYLRVGADEGFILNDDYLVFAAGAPLTTTLPCRWTEPLNRSSAKLDWLSRNTEPFELVRQMADLPAAMRATVQSDGRPFPDQQKRDAIYVRLRTLGDSAVPALRQGLGDPDVRIRRNVALYLGFEAGNYAKHAPAGLDVKPFRKQLIDALGDSDQRVMELAGQAVAFLGPDGKDAVPVLIDMLSDSREGIRNSACIGLSGIGPAAAGALPALRRALTDPSKDVRGFAQRAIEHITGPAGR